MNLYRNESSHAKVNAQRNLSGRTHYVDDDTLKFHKSRVISTHVVDGGLLFAIVTSDQLDYAGTKRGFRYVIFDLFGTVLERTGTEQTFHKSSQASKAMWTALNEVAAGAHSLDAADKALENYTREIAELKTAIVATVAQKAA